MASRITPAAVKVAACGAALTLGGCGRNGTAQSAPSSPIVLRVASDGEFLAFTPTELSCPTGERVRVIFHHTGQRLPQDHNWVLVLPGSNDSVLQAGMSAGPQAGYMPRGDARVLAATPLCGRGAEAVVEFTAPLPGDYPFLCTFPGHGAVMNGILHVTAK